MSKAASAALLIIVLAACGGPAAASSASGSAASLDALYQQAKADGTVEWYTSLADAVIGPIIDAFQAAYPGVKVNRTQMTADQLLSTLQVQQAAHHVTIDVGSTIESNVSDLLDAKIAANVDWTKLGVPKERILQNVLVTYWYSPNVVVYNTQKVAPADAPKSWDDLLDPKWQDKIAMDGRGSMLEVFVASSQLGGAAKGLEFAQKLAAQHPLYQANNSAVEPMVISGQVLVASDILPNLIGAQKKGAPIDLAPISPIHSPGNFAYVPAGAPHMSAAQLLVAWLASPDGLKALDTA
ncbi:MAG: extracellular solute-binding protein, partial [Chloroflexi bacterium]|nr:extracellular solute-binding protein [Chloroflexota bacterium]